jgi:hypothetical protein
VRYNFPIHHLVHFYSNFWRISLSNRANWNRSTSCRDVAPGGTPGTLRPRRACLAVRAPPRTFPRHPAPSQDPWSSQPPRVAPARAAQPCHRWTASPPRASLPRACPPMHRRTAALKRRLGAASVRPSINGTDPPPSRPNRYRCSLLRAGHRTRGPHCKTSILSEGQSANWGRICKESKPPGIFLQNGIFNSIRHLLILVKSIENHKKFRKLHTKFCWTPGEKLYNYCYSCLSCFLIIFAWK